MVIMIRHTGSFIHIDTVADIDRIAGLADTIFKRHHDGGDFKGRTGFRFVCHGMVGILAVDAFTNTPHVGNGFHLACRDFHDDSRTRCSVDLFQHVEQRLLGYILDIDVDRRADIHSFHRIDLYDIRPSSTETAYGIQAGYAVEQSIVLQFQTVLSLCQPCFRIDIAERVADRTGGQCPERLLPFDHLPRVEAALEPSQTEEREFLYFLQVGIGNFTVTNGELAAFLLQTIQQVILISGRRPVFQFAGKVKRKGVDPVMFTFQKRIQAVPLLGRMGIAVCVEIDIQIKARHTGRHQLAVGRIDISTARIDQAVRTLLALGHLHPSLPFHKSRIEGTHQDAYCYQSEQQHDKEVTE